MGDETDATIQQESTTAAEGYAAGDGEVSACGKSLLCQEVALNAGEEGKANCPEAGFVGHNLAAGFVRPDALNLECDSLIPMAC